MIVFADFNISSTVLALFFGVLEECGCESLDSRRRSWGGCGWKIDKGAYKGQGIEFS